MVLGTLKKEKKLLHKNLLIVQGKDLQTAKLMQLACGPARVFAGLRTLSYLYPIKA